MKIVSAACLAGLLWLTGCATTTPDPADTSATASQTGKTPQAPLPRPYTPFFPDGPLQPITAAQAAAMGVAATAPPADMWERIRRGFAMPNLETDQVSDQEQWYATRPDYMQRMTERSSKYLFHIVE
ncbi:MAG: lytic transglycosylase, partial [Xylophilus sp.]|nr:lytic transglycosylase [Xylophilus sp.]